MKLVIPQLIKIGAHDYQIVWWNKKMQNSAESTAQASAKSQVIRLDPDWSDTMKFEHLIHEVRHQVDYLLNDHDETEKRVRAESSYLCQGILSLGIEPDFSQIKEEKL